MRVDYRGVRFHKTAKGVWIFDAPPPSRWSHWERFFLPGEEWNQETMRRAIDRMLRDSPVFTGDLRDVKESRKKFSTPAGGSASSLS